MDVSSPTWPDSYDTEALWEIYWDYKAVLSDLNGYENTAIPHLRTAAYRTLQEIETELTRRAEEQVGQVLYPI